jgi:hypothetical protein
MWHRIHIQCQKALQKNTGTSRVGPPYTFSKLETRGYVPRLQTIYTSQQLPLDISFAMLQHKTTDCQNLYRSPSLRDILLLADQSNCKMVMQEKY